MLLAGITQDWLTPFCVQTNVRRFGFVCLFFRRLVQWYSNCVPRNLGVSRQSFRNSVNTFPLYLNRLTTILVILNYFYFIFIFYISSPIVCITGAGFIFQCKAQVIKLCFFPCAHMFYILNNSMFKNSF